MSLLLGDLLDAWNLFYCRICTHHAAFYWPVAPLLLAVVTSATPASSAAGPAAGISTNKPKADKPKADKAAKPSAAKKIKKAADEAAGATAPAVIKHPAAKNAWFCFQEENRAEVKGMHLSAERKYGYALITRRQPQKKWQEMDLQEWWDKSHAVTALM